MILFTTLLITLAANPVAWEVKRLAPIPDPEGFACPFAGISHGTLLVAGGANFPTKKPWEGGTKIWYDTVWALDRPAGEWKKAGKLPRPLAYGVWADHHERVICAGGSDADKHHSAVFSLEWKDGKINVNELPALPRPIANACGTVVGAMLYIAGGQEKPDSTSALKAFYALDLTAKDAKWRELDAWPGPGRILATAASFDGTFWLIGGTDLSPDKDGKAARTYLKDVYRFHPKTGWTREADLPCSIVAAPTPAAVDHRGIHLFGGDDGTNLGFQPPEKHPGFRKTALVYDPTTKAWKHGDELPVARVTVPLIHWGDTWIMPNGERGPGVRSPDVWQFEPKP